MRAAWEDLLTLERAIDPDDNAMAYLRLWYEEFHAELGDVGTILKDATSDTKSLSGAYKKEISSKFK